MQAIESNLKIHAPETNKITTKGRKIYGLTV